MAAAWLDLGVSDVDSYCGYTILPINHVFEIAAQQAWIHTVTESHWFIIDFGASYDITKVRGRSDHSQDPTSVDIYISDNKVDFGTAVVTGITSFKDTQVWQEENCVGTGRYMKVVITSTQDAVNSYLGWGIAPATAAIKWFDVYGEASTGTPTKATNPTPADGSGPGVDFSDWTISWSDGGGATSFKIYAGTASGVLSYVTEQAGTSYQFAALSSWRTALLGGVIYWRIDAVNENGTTTGDEWSFDPRPAKVSNPSPSNGASDQSVLTTPITWDASALADSYDVYFDGAYLDTSLEAVTKSLAEVLPLDYSYEFSWRIDPKNEFGTTTGDTWTFTTLDHDPPRVSCRYIADGSPVPAGTPFDPDTMFITGENFMTGVRRLIVFSGTSLWFETIDLDDP